MADGLLGSDPTADPGADPGALALFATDAQPTDSAPAPAAPTSSAGDGGDGDGGGGLDITARIGRALGGGPAGIADLTPAQEAAAGHRSLLNFGLSLLQGGGYSYMPRTFGQILATGLGAAEETRTAEEQVVAAQRQQAAQTGIQQQQVDVQKQAAAIKLAQFQYQMKILQQQARAAENQARQLRGLPPLPDDAPVGGAPGGGSASVQGGDPATFVSSALPLAKDVAAKTGLPVEYVMGQAGLETGWGTSDAAKTKNNFFGISNPDGTLKSYDSPEEGFAAYSALMNGDRYKGVPRTGSPAEIGDAMNAAGYSTTPDYGTRVGKFASTVTPLLRTASIPGKVAVAEGGNPEPGSDVFLGGTTAAPATAADVPVGGFPPAAMAADTPVPPIPPTGAAPYPAGAQPSPGQAPDTPAPGVPTPPVAAPGLGYNPQTGGRLTIVPGQPLGEGRAAPGMPNADPMQLPPAIREAFASRLQQAAMSPDPAAATDKVRQDMITAAIDWAKTPRYSIMSGADANAALRTAFNPTAAIKVDQFGNPQVFQEGQPPINPADTPEGKVMAVGLQIAQKQLETSGTAADQARKIRGSLDELNSLNAQVGPGGDVLASKYKDVLPILEETGTGTPEQRQQWSAAQAFQGIAAKLATQMRDTGMGRLSNMDLEQFKLGVPSIATDQNTRQMMINYLNQAANRQIQEHEFALDYFQKNHTTAGLDNAMSADPAQGGLGPMIRRAPDPSAPLAQHQAFAGGLRAGEVYYKPDGSMTMKPMPGQKPAPGQ